MGFKYPLVYLYPLIIFNFLIMNFKSKIDTVVPKAINKVGYILNPLLLKIFKEEGQLLIFYFHGLYRNLEDRKLKHVDPQNNITVDQFSDFIEYFIRNKYQFIGPEDLDDLSGEKPYIMITFDDGYFNNTWSLPVLKKYKVPATFFISTYNLLENKSFWWDVVYKFRTQEGVDLGIIRREQQNLKRFKYHEINAYLEEKFGSDCFLPWSDVDRPMTDEELKVFSAEEYVNIGNHTHNHGILTNHSETEILEEFKTSNTILDRITGQVPKTMAFPNGNFDLNILRIAKEIGYKCAFTTQGLTNRLPHGNDEMLLLNRFMARPVPISNYGSFSRLGYDGDTLYNGFKDKVMNLI